MKKIVSIVTILFLSLVLTLTFSFYACTPNNEELSKDTASNIGITNENAVESNDFNEYYIDEKTQNNTKNSQNQSNYDENLEIPSTDNAKQEVQNIRFIAPFVDMVSWVDVSSPYSKNGAINLKKLAEDSGNYTYSLGFIQLNQSNPTNPDGTARWGWGGYYDLSEKGNDGYQYEGIKSSIKELKQAGGEVIVSFGGQLGLAPWTVCQDTKVLMQMYLEVINAYDLKRIDLDIEESNQDAYQNYQNALALKEVQDATGVNVTLTIPISPSGWEQKQIDVIKAYLGTGLNVDIINSMTMCYYGYGVHADEDYGDASIRALKNAKEQLKTIYSGFGITLTDKDAYSLMGATVAIGAESGNPDFTADLTRKLVSFCKDAGVRQMAMWNMERDATIEKNSGIHGKYEHIKELFKFL